MVLSALWECKLHRNDREIVANDTMQRPVNNVTWWEHFCGGRDAGQSASRAANKGRRQRFFRKIQSNSLLVLSWTGSAEQKLVQDVPTFIKTLIYNRHYFPTPFRILVFQNQAMRATTRITNLSRLICQLLESLTPRHRNAEEWGSHPGDSSWPLSLELPLTMNASAGLSVGAEQDKVGITYAVLAETFIYDEFISRIQRAIPDGLPLPILRNARQTIVGMFVMGRHRIA